MLTVSIESLVVVALLDAMLLILKVLGVVIDNSFVGWFSDLVGVRTTPNRLVALLVLCRTVLFSVVSRCCERIYDHLRYTEMELADQSKGEDMNRT